VVPCTRRHRYFSTLSMAFGAGRVTCLSHLLHGDTIIFFPSIFSAAEFVEAVSRHRVTATYVVPSVVRQLMAITEPDKPLLSGLDILMTAGAPLFANEKREALHRLTPYFHEFYGATAMGNISVLRPEAMLDRPTSVGRPFPLVEVEIVDENDRPVGLEQIGQLRCRGPALASPIATSDPAAATEFRHGWHYPGELASLDSDAYVYLHGRTTEVVFRGASKIFPAEVEAVLQAHTGVAESAVVAARASRGSEQEMVAYVIAAGPVSPGQLLAHCRRQLTPYKVPKAIHIVSELPRNPNGKIDKRTLASGLLASG
jgi:acyl-coenzyme A synthetase/AMP-(fatty) acid ligase